MKWSLFGQLLFQTSKIFIKLADARKEPYVTRKSGLFWLTIFLFFERKRFIFRLLPLCHEGAKCRNRHAQKRRGEPTSNMKASQTASQPPLRPWCEVRSLGTLGKGPSSCKHPLTKGHQEVNISFLTHLILQGEKNKYFFPIITF